MSRPQPSSEGRPFRRAGRAYRQGRRWLDVAECGEVDATCWIPEDQILVRVRPRWTAWQVAAVVLVALARAGTRRPKVVLFVGPSREVYHARWLYHLRCLAAHCGVGTQATYWSRGIGR